MDQIEQVRRKVDIVELISEHIPLKKAGRNFKANCPFHEEKTPSFMVSPERQIFKCFGCGEGGDVYGFLMKREGLEAIRWISCEQVDPLKPVWNWDTDLNLRHHGPEPCKLFSLLKTSRLPF